MSSAVADPLIMAVDQGTSATKGVLCDSGGNVVSRAAFPMTQQHRRPGWVEQDPNAVIDSVRAVIAELQQCTDRPIAALGLSTQRESALVWERCTGRAVSPVLGWQDRRTAERAGQLIGCADRVREISGLPLDPMFSALKLGWILDEVDLGRERSRSGELLAGTVDSWLLWNLTGEHRIEVGNASRTQLLDLKTGDWSDELLELFGIPRECLPAILASDASSATAVVGMPLLAVLGDSHAALFGHGVRAPGEVKATYGTGSSIMGLSDDVVTGPGLGGTIAWSTAGGGIARAFEGNILASGATVHWLAELLATTPDELAGLARSAADSGGVNIVPAFAGLGAPWWDERAVAAISGFHLGVGRAQLARAAFESIVLQIEDVLAAVEREVGIRVERVLADGGPSRNDWLMQLQADMSGRCVARHDGTDLSALGVGRLAAETAGIVPPSVDRSAARSTARNDTHTEFYPDAAAAVSDRRVRWSAALERSLSVPRVPK